MLKRLLLLIVFLKSFGAFSQKSIIVEKKGLGSVNDTVVILESKLAIVDELTPPILFTVGELAVPPKSPVNCTIPFTDVDASEGAEVVVQVKVPLPVVLNT